MRCLSKCKNVCTRCQFHQNLTREFFLQKFIQSLTQSREKIFVWKRRAQNVHEIDTNMPFLTRLRICAFIFFLNFNIWFCEKCADQLNMEKNYVIHIFDYEGHDLWHTQYVNAHLQTTITCQQRPLQIPPNHFKSWSYLWTVFTCQLQPAAT